MTGGNSGLGYETVRALAKKNAEVILACRNLAKGMEAIEKIKSEENNIIIQAMQLDLSDLKSVHQFAEEYLNQYKTLDVLINNAGIMMVPYNLTKDGFESQFGVNHLGHFALTGLLLDRIKNTPHSRVVNVSSMAHKSGKMDFANLMFEKGKGYNRIKAYGRSKLANLLFTYEMQRYFETRKIKSIAVAAHPGISDTNLPRYIEGKFVLKLLKPLFSVFGQSAGMGALPQLRAAIDKNVSGGECYGPAGWREFAGSPVQVQSNKASHDIDDAKKLWDISEKLTGVTFPK